MSTPLIQPSSSAAAAITSTEDVLQCRIVKQPIAAATEPSTTATNPQNEYMRALNFESEQPKMYVDGRPTNDANADKMKNMMSSFMVKINNSNYVYPGIALIVATLLLIIIIFQCTTFISKVLAVMIYILFVCITVYQNMGP